MEYIAFWGAPSSFGACVWLVVELAQGVFACLGVGGREYPGGVRGLPSLPEGSDPLFLFFGLGDGGGPSSHGLVAEWLEDRWVRLRCLGPSQPIRGLGRERESGGAEDLVGRAGFI